ncbi:MAG TPA: hypothetical protein ENJ23_03325, partial [Bacteroidetes bacterium]|nr:hypothetical protein [Bacteroidota bacterium]
VSGLSLADARRTIIQRVEKVFANVDITFTLRRIRIFRVGVAGEVKNPGTYLASAVDRATDLLELAGGTLEEASGRGILLIRSGDTLRVDLQRFSRLGDLNANPFLREGDLLVVPVRSHMAQILGAVFQPGELEFVPGETFGDLLPLTGGFRQDAILDSLELARFDSSGFEIEKRILPWTEAAKIQVRDDDRLVVRRHVNWHRKRGVWVEGEVKFPGYYAINRGEMMLSELIRKAGGFTPEASLVEAHVIRGQENARKDPVFERLKKMDPADMTDLEYSYFKQKSQEIPGAMSVDFERLFLQGDHSQDILLEDGDRIIVPRIRNYITVSGQVVYPGNIPYRPGLKPRDYIALAGGFSWNARKSKIRVIRARTGEWMKLSKVKQLEPGDTIWVPEKPERDWWLLFRQVMTVAAQGATLYLVVHTAISK